MCFATDCCGYSVNEESTTESEHVESGVAGGLVLLAATAIALIWANSPFSHSYERVWAASTGVGAGRFVLRLTVHQWVNDGLMAIFFFVVGREIKHEVLFGKLASLRRAALPVAAALGGMIIPALIYAALNVGGRGTSGWGVPMATDIAFALGILALVGKGLPDGLRVLLAALAVVDDLGAILVIAVFYGSQVDVPALVAAGVLFAALLGLRRRRVPSLGYVVAGIALWIFVFESGVHATVAGVLLAFAMPSSANEIENPPALTRFVTYGVLPLFALANAGVPLHGVGVSLLHEPVTLGVLAGLLLGKPIGVMSASVLAVRSGLAQLPIGVSWRQVHGIAWLAGIGFTVALFVAELAFADREMLNAAKLGVLAGSICAGLVGAMLIRLGRS